MAPNVEEAIAEIRETFPGLRVEVEPEAQGGAYVVVHDLEFDRLYTPERTWIGFSIPFQYPDVDVYPHFADAALARVDGTALASAFQKTMWRGQPVTQISRRSNRWNAATDTAALKLRKVLAWMRDH